MEDRHGGRSGELVDEVRQQTSADDHRVRVGSLDLDAHWLCHRITFIYWGFFSFASRPGTGAIAVSFATNWPTTRAGLRLSVRTRTVATER